MFLLNIGDTVKVLVGCRCITAVVNKLVGSLAKISYSIDGMNTESRYIYKGSYQIRMINGNVVKVGTYSKIVYSKMVLVNFTGFVILLNLLIA